MGLLAEPMANVHLSTWWHDGCRGNLIDQIGKSFELSGIPSSWTKGVLLRRTGRMFLVPLYFVFVAEEG